MLAARLLSSFPFMFFHLLLCHPFQATTFLRHGIKLPLSLAIIAQTAMVSSRFLLLFLLLFPYLSCTSSSSLLPYSEVQALLLLSTILHRSAALQTLIQESDFCNLPPSSSLTIACSNGATTVTELHIVGDNAGTAAESFSVDPRLWQQLSELPNLTVLKLTSLGLSGSLPSDVALLSSSLQVLNLSSNFFSGALPWQLTSLARLQILALDNNLLSGSLPPRWISLQSLTIFSASSNKLSGYLPPSLFSLPNLKTVILDNNRFNGHFPKSITSALNLQLLSLARNNLTGNLPDLSALASLQAFNIEQNRLGPDFPLLGNQLLFLAMGGNRFRCHIPLYINNLQSLQQIDLSSNFLFGVPPSSIFELPNLQYLNMARNHLSGSLLYNLSFGKSLRMLDISFNLFTGPLPPKLISSSSEGITVILRGNCLTTRLQLQNPYSHCQEAALAGITPRLSTTSARGNHFTFFAGVAGGAFALVVASIIFIVIVSRRLKRTDSIKSVKGSFRETNSATFSSDFLSTARYISKLGALGLSRYRVFSLNELYEATQDFNTSNLLGEGSIGKVYKGRLEDGYLVAIKCITLKSKHGIRSINLHLELLAKLRHQHLVSLLGHCLENEEDCRMSGRLFLVFELLSGGTLRNRIAGTNGQDYFTWSQRLVAVTGVAKGIQFLHSGVVSGVLYNDLKITNIILDQYLVAKISDYALPIPHINDINMKNFDKTQGPKELEHRKRLSDKTDIFNFGLILLELVFGRPPIIEKSADGYLIKELEMLMEEGQRAKMMDPRIMGSCPGESVATVIEIAIKCLLKDAGSRPSIEDVLWNLQYALQVEDRSNGEYQDDIPDIFFPGAHREGGRGRKSGTMNIKSSEGTPLKIFSRQ